MISSFRITDDVVSFHFVFSFSPSLNQQKRTWNEVHVFHRNVMKTKNLPDLETSSHFCLCAQLIKTLRGKDIWRSGCIDPRILILYTSWRWVVSFTPRPLYHRENSPCYPLDPRTGMDDMEGRKFWPIKGLELQPLIRPARSQSLWTTALFRHPRRMDGVSK
jgi:hypothetical protein